MQRSLASHEPRRGLVELTRPATLQQFSDCEPRSLDELAGCYFTLTPDLMRPDLWSWEDAPHLAVLVAASACWDGSGLRAYPWPSTSTVRFCGSGGFVFGRRAGGFPFSSDDYHAWLMAMRPDVAACLDLPCEVQIAADDAEVARRQRWTLEAAGELMRRSAPWLGWASCRVARWSSTWLTLALTAPPAS